MKRTTSTGSAGSAPRRKSVYEDLVRIKDAQNPFSRWNKQTLSRVQLKMSYSKTTSGIEEVSISQFKTYLANATGTSVSSVASAIERFKRDTNFSVASPNTNFTKTYIPVFLAYLGFNPILLTERINASGKAPSALKDVIEGRVQPIYTQGANEFLDAIMADGHLFDNAGTKLKVGRSVVSGQDVVLKQFKSSVDDYVGAPSGGVEESKEPDASQIPLPPSPVQEEEELVFEDEGEEVFQDALDQPQQEQILPPQAMTSEPLGAGAGAGIGAGATGIAGYGTTFTPDDVALGHAVSDEFDLSKPEKQSLITAHGGGTAGFTSAPTYASFSEGEYVPPDTIAELQERIAEIRGKPDRTDEEQMELDDLVLQLTLREEEEDMEAEEFETEEQREEQQQVQSSSANLYDRLFGLTNKPKFHSSIMGGLMSSLGVSPSNEYLRKLKRYDYTKLSSAKLSKRIDAMVELYGKRIGVKKRLTNRRSSRADLEQELNELDMLVAMYYMSKFGIIQQQPKLAMSVPMDMMSSLMPLINQLNSSFGGASAMMGGGMFGGMGLMSGGVPPIGGMPIQGQPTPSQKFQLVHKQNVEQSTGLKTLEYGNLFPQREKAGEGIREPLKNVSLGLKANTQASVKAKMPEPIFINPFK